jgi:glucosamine-6-phosphate deaminase
MKTYSNVENYYLSKSGKKLIYEPTEKMPVIQVDNFPELGELTALRFIEWLQANPEGVVSLPTGKTPEHFIFWVTRILQDWDKPEIENLLKKVGLDSKKRPDLSKIKFVQIDEFYPIDSSQHNSFHYYIHKYYIKNFGLNTDNALLIDVNKIGTANNLPLDDVFPDKIVDLSLRTRMPSTRLERLQKETIEIVDEYCTQYEKKIREMGGIGFFLGGIGPDGHIGFNVQGSDHYSSTRLIATNYQTQAAASTDLGGIEIAANRLVITIGLATITYNKKATALIIAAGEAKSKIVRDSIENNPSNQYPATVLQELRNSRFYLTHGAAMRMVERRYVDVDKEQKLAQSSLDRAVINLSIKLEKEITALTKQDYESDRLASLVLKKSGKTVNQINESLNKTIIDRFNRGMTTPENEVILHTAPHHDDIMLGYLPFINHLVRTPLNKHHFSIFTSGFNAVTNSYMLKLMERLKEHLKSGIFDDKLSMHYFDPDSTEGKDSDVSLYLDSIANNSRTMRREALSRRLLRNMIEIYEEDSITYLKDRVDELINYFTTQYPGKKDIPHVQKLKGMLREWEEEIMWAYFGFSTQNVSHLRLGFYKGNIFTENPETQRDVFPIVKLLKEIKPTIITVALDPEGSGPDTHYKVLQAVSEALKIYGEEADLSKIRIWGYRNVWYRFHPAEANIFIPVSLNSMAILEDTFMNSYGSQKDASFPSWEYDGPFCRLAQKILVDQYQKIRTCLGKKFFLNNSIPRARAAHGMLYLSELTAEEFYKHSMELKKLVENR